MMRPSDTDRALAVWLADAPGKPSPDPLTDALDDLFARGPSPESAHRAAQSVRRALARSAAPQVYFARIARTPVGPLCVAVTDQGVCAVDFESSERAFARRLARRGVRPARSLERVSEVARQLREYLSGARPSFDLSVDLRSLTEFQRRVLEAAARIPRGQVATYGQIAHRVGRPNAARAVGQALGHNPIPIIIPCHRVLASDGSLGGYSGRHGVRTKAQLLRLEGAMPS